MPISQKVRDLIKAAWDDGAPCLVATEEMRDVFNLGVGLITVLPRADADAALAAAKNAGVEAWVCGEVRRGTQGVRFTS